MVFIESPEATDYVPKVLSDPIFTPLTIKAFWVKKAKKGWKNVNIFKSYKMVLMESRGATD